MQLFTRCGHPMVTIMCSAEQVTGGRLYDDRFCECPGAADDQRCATFFACASFAQQPHRTGLLYASRVEDGICDCCDGSDETGMHCPNMCETQTPRALFVHGASRADEQLACVQQRLGAGQSISIGVSAAGSESVT